MCSLLGWILSHSSWRLVAVSTSHPCFQQISCLLQKGHLDLLMSRTGAQPTPSTPLPSIASVWTFGFWWLFHYFPWCSLQSKVFHSFPTVVHSCPNGFPWFFPCSWLFPMEKESPGLLLVLGHLRALTMHCNWSIMVEVHPICIEQLIKHPIWI